MKMKRHRSLEETIYEKSNLNTEKERREKGIDNWGKKLFEELNIENFPELVKDRTVYSGNTKESATRLL